MRVSINISPEQKDVIDAIRAVAGRPMFVGGIVRDTIMGHKSKDVDIEVFGATFDQVMDAIRFCDSVRDAKVTGEKFQVITVTTNDGINMDVAMPRRERKVSAGSNGFIADVDPFMSFEEAAERRDFTINAIMADCATGEVFDFFDGVEDIQRGIIRACGPRFVESPDRMIRAGRFAAQKGFEVDQEVVRMCQEMAEAGEFQTINKEKMRDEMIKIGKSQHPSKAIRFFMKAGFGPFMPEIEAMIGCQQDPRWHPEGDVFEHTCQVADQAARVCTERGIEGDERVIHVMAAFCHDMGKPETTVFEEDGSITSAGHAEAGVPIAEAFMRRMGFETASMIERVCKIVEFHMRGIGVKPTARIVRRMAAKMAPATITDFAIITEADASGRSKGIFKPGAAFEEIAQAEACAEKPQAAIIMGRHVMAEGIKPGPMIGQIVRACSEAQIDGEFKDIEDGIAFMRHVIANIA